MADETIGKITLKLDKYPGKDFYCDGEVEDELLEIAKSRSSVEYDRIIEERADWPTLYHLSAQRENIVDFLPIRRTDRVLEVGSGCGAITGALARKAKSVTCVELSHKRSLINAYRHSDCSNVTIHVGNFKDIEPDLPCDYDYICLIGVFEYALSYIGGARPYEEFIEILLRHVAANGRIVIAIENKYGLKYFAGCREDHLGTWFSGIENYPDGGVVRTFSRNGLEQIFKACGVTEYGFYYPYPDYKFMTSVYSDAYLPGRGELNNNLRNFDRDRMLLFDEKTAFDGIVDEKLFSTFANSYMAVLGRGFDLKFAKYSNDRAPKYRIRTEIYRDENGVKEVRKYPMSPEAEEHVRGMATAYEMLTERYAGSELCVNPCTLVEEDGTVYASFPFEEGRPLSEHMDRCVAAGDTEGFYRLFDEYLERVGYNEDYPAADFDLIFANILVDGDTWKLIDYEWTFGKAIPVKELAFRAVYCYLMEDDHRNAIDVDRVLERLGISDVEAQELRRQEMEFQKMVTDGTRSMAEIRNLIGEEVLKPVEWVHRFRSQETSYRVQIYEDRGKGFSEEASYFVRDAYPEEGKLTLKLRADGDVHALRIDPAMCPCICKVDEISWNGEEVPLRNKKVFAANGQVLRSEDGELHPSIVFATEDPGITISVEHLKRAPLNKLWVSMDVVAIPMAAAKDMAAAAKKLF